MGISAGANLVAVISQKAKKKASAKNKIANFEWSSN
ncbi:MAG: hypothetical protein IPG38_19020 [Chitinophagaceae bacterium]|nr:hypothetical protein [Chitinophagaceae bacterium]